MLSRFLPAADGSVLFGRAPTRDLLSPDVEAQTGSEIDHANLREDFETHELDDVLGGPSESHITTEDTAFFGGPAKRHPGRERTRSGGFVPRARWMMGDRTQRRRVDEDDDVPESLLLEQHSDPTPTNEPAPPPPVTGIPTNRAQEQWDIAQAEHRLHEELGPGATTLQKARRVMGKAEGMREIQDDPRQMALWRWANVQDLDAFLLEVYEYYHKKGIWSILLSKGIDLATSAFFFSLALVMSTCIDYSKLPRSKSSSDILIPQCIKNMPWYKNFVLWLFVFCWLFTLSKHIRSFPKLIQMRDFYEHILRIPDDDMQMIKWSEVVDALVSLRDQNLATAEVSRRNKQALKEYHSKQRMDAHDIANRIMRKENYYIAMINKDILDVTLPVPFVGDRKFYSKQFELWIHSCFDNFIFDAQNRINPSFLKPSMRSKHIEDLRLNLRSAAAFSLVLAPYTIAQTLVRYVFTYFTLLRDNPSKLSARSFTPFAEWKFREINEVEHHFRERMEMAEPFAAHYLDQFPGDKIAQIKRFVCLVAATLFLTLTAATVFDSELFLAFEITQGRTAVFYLSMLSAVFLAVRSDTSDSTRRDPKLALLDVIGYTHWAGTHWWDKLHSNEVRVEFSSLFQLKILIILEEVLSIIVVPLLLLRNANDRCEQIVDFFREFTVHVDGLGHVCSFAIEMFNFELDRRAERDNKALKKLEGIREKYYKDKDGKMAASYADFMKEYLHQDPRSGTHNANASKVWHPPPEFPGFTSPPQRSILAHGRGWIDPDKLRPWQNTRGKQAVASTVQGQHAPMHSTLLDPERQNPFNKAHSSPCYTAKSQRPRSRRPLEHYAEDDEENEFPTADDSMLERPIPIDASVMEFGSPSRGRSYATQSPVRAGRARERPKTPDEAAGPKNAGVLGLIYQFSKAQRGGRGAAVNI
ncbi:autophagy protein atg9 [Elasticomyces elasticus]|nr:autophagy protein atg9 [Elasticomyces elasticus]